MHSVASNDRSVADAAYCSARAYACRVEAHLDAEMSARMPTRQAESPRHVMPPSIFMVLLMLLAVVGRAEVIDRIAITVGPRAITESDILREIRLAAFFDQAEADLSPLAKRRAAGRLVERALIEMEMEAGQYEFPEASEVAPALAALKKGPFPMEAARLSEIDVQRHLLQRLALESFMDERFGPAVQISDDEMRAYYSTHYVPDYEKLNKAVAPPFEEARGDVGIILRAQRANELLNTWLKETRGRIRIEFKDEALQ